jgi:hydroxyethylthiazole kinase-like uncharacterized protein yjeF
VNLKILERMDCEFVPAFEPGHESLVRQRVQDADVIVDALLGTGSRGAPRGVMADLIVAANAAPRARRIALDIPSGLDADSGVIGDPCFHAHATVTLVASKVGLTVPAARRVVGRLVVVDIGVPRGLIPGRKFRRNGLDS